MSADHFPSSSLRENDVDTLENNRLKNNRDEPCRMLQSIVDASSKPPAESVALPRVFPQPSPKNRRLKAAPNHFFAVQISDWQILEAVRDVQKTIVDVEPRLKTALIPPATLHVTLAVIHLACSQQVALANQVMEDSVKFFLSGLPSPSQQLDIHLAQVGHFNNKVIYAGIHQEGVNHLNFLWKSLSDGCRSAGLSLIDADRFSPHVTLLKLSKDPKLRRKGIKAVPSHLYESHVERVFGRQMIESVQLLSMTAPKDDRGYYALQGEFHFSQGMKTTVAAANVEV